MAGVHDDMAMFTGEELGTAEDMRRRVAGAVAGRRSDEPGLRAELEALLEAVRRLLRGPSCGLDPGRDARAFEALRRHCAYILGNTDLVLRTPDVETALHGARRDPGDHVRGEAWHALRRALTAPEPPSPPLARPSRPPPQPTC